MAITLRQLAYEFRRVEAGGDPGPDFPISEAYAILLARQCLNELLGHLIFAYMDSDDRGPIPMYIATYTVDVEGEDNHKYLDLPEFYQPMPFNKGLKGIAPVEEPTHEFVPRHNPSVSYNLPCADVEQQQSYYVEGTRVFFDKEVGFTKLLVKLIIAAPDSITEDAALPIFANQQAPLLRLMRVTYSNRPIQDKIIDGNKDLGTTIPIQR